MPSAPSTVMFVVLVQALLFAVGAAIGAIIVLAKRRPAGWVGLVITKLGVAASTAILLKVVFPARAIPVSVEGLAYTIAIFVTAVGMVMTSAFVMKRAGRRSAQDAAL